jgi:hypothetical protein
MKLNPISIAKKEIGGMYIDSKSSFSAGIDIFCSVIIYVVLAVAIWNKVNKLGEMVDVQISSLPEDGFNELFS